MALTSSQWYAAMIHMPQLMAGAEPMTLDQIVQDTCSSLKLPNNRFDQHELANTARSLARQNPQLRIQDQPQLTWDMTENDEEWDAPSCHRHTDGVPMNYRIVREKHHLGDFRLSGDRALIALESVHHTLADAQDQAQRIEDALIAQPHLVQQAIQRGIERTRELLTRTTR